MNKQGLINRGSTLGIPSVLELVAFDSFVCRFDMREVLPNTTVLDTSWRFKAQNRTARRRKGQSNRNVRSSEHHLVLLLKKHMCVYIYASTLDERMHASLNRDRMVWASCIKSWRCA